MTLTLNFKKEREELDIEYSNGANHGPLQLGSAAKQSEAPSEESCTRERHPPASVTLSSNKVSMHTNMYTRV